MRTVLYPTLLDGIALLNVLDRCDTPFTLLAQLRAMLRPGSGRLILAVVIPFRPFVEDGKTHRAPKVGESRGDVVTFFLFLSLLVSADSRLRIQNIGIMYDRSSCTLRRGAPAAAVQRKLGERSEPAVGAGHQTQRVQGRR